MNPPAALKNLPFEYNEFTAWYETQRRAAFEPARQTFCRITQELLDVLTVEHGEGRFRPPQSRIKDPVRLWAKMNTPKYQAKISGVEAIPDVIDDLVGVRIICTNKSDVSKLKGALEVLNRLRPGDKVTGYGVAVQAGSERDYIETPKESGYRAYHVNLLAEVPRIGGTVAVTGELQVRTLLQDGWGELTHEDTYKPGQSVPQLVQVLSLRMGELLATVDDIAQDIQHDLERASLEDVLGAETADSLLGADSHPDPVGAGAQVSEEIVIAEANRLVSMLTRPMSLAGVAAKLRATFGQEVAKDWLGHKSFKEFLLHAVPDAEIVLVGPSYVIPRGVEPDDSWPESLRSA